MQQFKQTIVTVLAELVPFGEAQIAGMVATPPKPFMGDLGFPCFTLAPVLYKTPSAICKGLADSINAKIDAGTIHGIDHVESAGAYLNFFSPTC